MTVSSTSWKKGVSGNPGGRPKATVKITREDGSEVELTITELAREHSPKAIQTLVDIMESTQSPAAARVSAANSILERAFGKVPQMLIGDPEQPLAMANLTLEQVLAARAQVVDEC